MKIFVKVTAGAHLKEHDINKQINDKERVAAAVENPNIHAIIKRGFKNSDRFEYSFWGWWSYIIYDRNYQIIFR